MSRVVASRTFLARVVIWRIVLCALVATPILFGQTRSAYQQAYREWQQGDPNLEHDAGSAGEALIPRTEKAAADAGKFISARRAYYDAQRAEIAEKLQALQPVTLPVETDGVKTAEAYLSPQETSIANSIGLFSGDSDPGIKQLRQALEKERQALIALKSAIGTRENPLDTAAEAHDRVDHAAGRASEGAKVIAASFAQSEHAAEQLAEAWPFYYRAVSSGARGLQISGAMPGFLDPVPNSASGEDAPKSRFAGLWGFRVRRVHV